MYNRLSEGGTGLVAQRLEQRTHNAFLVLQTRDLLNFS